MAHDNYGRGPCDSGTLGYPPTRAPRPWGKELQVTMAIPQADLPFSAGEKVTDALGNGVFEPQFLPAGIIFDLDLMRHNIRQYLCVLQVNLTLVPTAQ